MGMGEAQRFRPVSLVILGAGSAGNMGPLSGYIFCVGLSRSLGLTPLTARLTLNLLTLRHPSPPPIRKAASMTRYLIINVVLASIGSAFFASPAQAQYPQRTVVVAQPTVVVNNGGGYGYAGGGYG